MPRRPSSLALSKEVLAFVLAGLLALTVLALSQWDGGGGDAPPPAPRGPGVPVGAPSVDP